MVLSIIIVNRNSTDYLLQCIEGIYGQSSGFDFEIIVVDNASHDNPAPTVADRFPEVLLIRSPTNLGFAGANNLGFSYSHGSWLLFLNPDTLVVGNAPATMLGHALALDRVGAIGCRLLNADLTVQTSSILRFPTILNQVVSWEALRLLSSRFAFWGIKPLFTDSPAPQEVEGISGACMLVKREAFIAAGGFNTEYFLYSEDVHLCCSIRKEGYRIYYTGDASVIHYGGRSTTKGGEKKAVPVLMKEATFRLLKAERGAAYAVCFKATIGLAAFIRLLVLAGAYPLALCCGRSGRTTRSLDKWLQVLLWSCGVRNAAKLTQSFGGTAP